MVRNQVLPLALLALSLLIVCHASNNDTTTIDNTTSDGGSTNKQQQQQQQQQQEATLPQLCKSIHKIKNISVMLELIEKLRHYFVERTKAIAQNKLQPPSTVSNFMQNLNVMSPKRNCLRQIDAIAELEPIIRETQRVCSWKHLDKIEAYRKKHIPESLYNAARPKVTQSFFVLYAGQVSVVCKQNLRKSLEAAERQLIGTEDFELITLFMKPPSYCEDNRSDQNQIINEDNSVPEQTAQKPTVVVEPENESESRKLRCNALNALSEIKSIDQLVAMLGMDFQLDSRSETDDASAEIGLEVELSAEARENLDKLYEICPKFERIYSQNIMSIVRLSRMGFDPTFAKFDDTCRNDELIQKWFGITVICESLLKDRRVQDPNLDARTYRRELDAITLSPIDDKLTIGKYLPGRFSKLSSDFVKTIKRTLHIGGDSTVYRSLANVGRYIAIALAMTVTLIASGWNGI